jgi:HSP20 family protein
MTTDQNGKTLARKQELFPSAFDNFFRPWNEWFDWGAVATVPAVNISEKDDRYNVSLAAPGLKKEDIKIDVHGSIVTISASAEKEEKEEEERYTRREYSYSSFSRSFTLPDTADIDHINASYENGVLQLAIPKKEEAKKSATRKIAVN